MPEPPCRITMPKKQIETQVIAEERTTLPEGATISVARILRPRLGSCTMLTAWMGDNIVKMRGDDISPNNLRWYLDNIVRHINRERVKIVVKPGMLFQNPKTLADFTNNMAFHGMFLLDVMKLAVGAGVEQPDAKPAKSRRKKSKPVKKPTNGSKPF